MESCIYTYISQYKFPFFKAIYSKAIQVINGRKDRERKCKFRAYNSDEVNSILRVNDKL
jgi:hypothetical protein